MGQPIRIHIWNEFEQEKTDAPVKAVYPDGIHLALADIFLSEQDVRVTTGTLDEPEQGLDPTILSETNVLIWWGHRAHHKVHDEKVELMHTRLLEGMGLIILHSAHFAKIFERAMGTSCRLGHWDENGHAERIQTIRSSHPITEGVPDVFEVPQTEMYSEPFDVPDPDETLFVSSFSKGEVFRSGCVWKRGRGRVFYFRPGHETYPIYRQPEIVRILRNAARWLASEGQ